MNEAPIPCAETPINRKQAIAAHEDFYFTGVACAHGHTAWRSVAGRECMACRDPGPKWKVDIKELPLRLLTRLRLRRICNDADIENRLSHGDKLALAQRHDKKITKTMLSILPPVRVKPVSERTEADAKLLHACDVFVDALVAHARASGDMEAVRLIVARSEIASVVEHDALALLASGSITVDEAARRATGPRALTYISALAHARSTLKKRGVHHKLTAAALGDVADTAGQGASPEQLVVAAMQAQLVGLTLDDAAVKDQLRVALLGELERRVALGENRGEAIASLSGARRALQNRYTSKARADQFIIQLVQAGQPVVADYAKMKEQDAAIEAWLKSKADRWFDMHEAAFAEGNGQASTPPPAQDEPESPSQPASWSMLNSPD